MSMFSSMVASLFKGPKGKDGQPRPLTPEELKEVLDNVKVVMNSIADFAHKHSVPAQEVSVETGGATVRLSITRPDAPKAA